MQLVNNAWTAAALEILRSRGLKEYYSIFEMKTAAQEIAKRLQNLGLAIARGASYECVIREALRRFQER